MIAAPLRRIDRGVALTAALILIYIVVFSVFSIGRYERYDATGYDLGAFTQLVWNASQGRPLQTTVAEQNNMLGIHAPYITIALAPLLWLWADPRVLLIAQTVILGLGAWPVARLARRHFPEWWVAPLFAALWLLYPCVGFINRWDVHEIAPVATFLAFAFEAADRQSWPQVDLWLALSIICKEEIGLNVAAFGVFMLWRMKRKRLPCLIWFFVGLAWFVIHAFVIFPALRPTANGLSMFAGRYTWLLSGDVPAMIRYLVGPGSLLKGAFLIEMFAPVAFLSLLAPEALIVAAPTFALSLLSSFQPQFDIFHHYTAPMIPAIIVSALYGAKRLRAMLERRHIKHPLRVLAGTALSTALVVWLIYNPLTYLPQPDVIYGWESGAHLDALRQVEALIPPQACVVAGNEVQPHYAIRQESYVLGARGDMNGCAYMIVDMSDGRFNTEFTDTQEVACTQYWSHKREPIYYRDTVVVLQQAPANPDPDAARGFTDYCGQYAQIMAKRGY